MGLDGPVLFTNIMRDFARAYERPRHIPYEFIAGLDCDLLGVALDMVIQ